MLHAATIRRYSQLSRLYPFKRQMRNAARNAALFMLSRMPRNNPSKEWIRFPFYHHVFEDEIRDFERHLSYFRQHGDFISIDDAIAIFESRKNINGRYFCLSFDDGFKNIIDNALPLLRKYRCPAAVFVPTVYIGCDIHREWEKVKAFFYSSRDAYPGPIEFLDWDDCRALRASGMTIGSHTNTHSAPARLTKEEFIRELALSKQRIEDELRAACVHLSCPWGIPGKHFNASDARVVKEAGYRSFLTSMRGPNFTASDPFSVRRDHVIAKWENFQLQYFFSQ